MCFTVHLMKRAGVYFCVEPGYPLEKTDDSCMAERCKVHLGVVEGGLMRVCVARCTGISTMTDYLCVCLLPSASALNEASVYLFV